MRTESAEWFPAYAAHELRTPLATQRVLLEVALDEPGASLAAWRQTGEAVLAACREQERLLEACLTLTRSRCGARRREPVDLAGITAHALRAENLGGLESVVQLEPARTTGDPALLERLVANLLSNAVRHNVTGGLVVVATRTAAGRANIRVANTGPHIPAVEILFRPFHGIGDGLGLGLAIVEAIAEAHDARLNARPRAGGGLAIDVSFAVPAARDRRADPGSPEASRTRPGAHPRRAAPGRGQRPLPASPRA